MSNIEKALKAELEDLQSQIGWMEEDLANLRNKEESLKWQIEDYIKQHEPQEYEGSNEIKDF